MTVYVIETQLTVDGKPVPGIWELSGIFATANGAAKAMDNIVRTFSALKRTVRVRTRVLEVQK